MERIGEKIEQGCTINRVRKCESIVAWKTKSNVLRLPLSESRSAPLDLLGRGAGHLETQIVSSWFGWKGSRKAGTP